MFYNEGRKEKNMKKYIYYIPEDITNEYLISHYNFIESPWHSHANLVNRDANRAGLEIWWATREVRILLGDHAEYGIMQIPDLLIQMINDGVIIKKEVDIDED